jgi:hypothetical protein
MRQILVVSVLCLVAFSVLAEPRRRAVRHPGFVSAPPRSIVFDFTGGSGLEWEPGFADYHPDTDMRTTADVRLLPPEIGSGTSWYLSGWNYSDDLFMFLQRRLDRGDRIFPSQNYLVHYTITLATNAGADCGGIGGAPGESVYVKLGAAPTRPEPVLVDDYLWMNIDKGNQAEGGVHASVAGNIAADVPLPCSSDAPFVTLVRNHEHPYAIPSTPSGELWLIFGTDSGFEGVTSIYVQKIEVRLTPVPADDPRTRWQTTYAEVFSIVAELEHAGIILRELGSSAFEPLGGRDHVYGVGESGTLEELHFIVFDTAVDAENAREMISADGTRIDGEPVEWLGTPHFFMGDHFIVNYVGSSQRILSILEQRLGPAFAGGQ